MEVVYIARDIGLRRPDIIAGIPVIAANTGTGEDDINKKIGSDPGCSMQPGLFFLSIDFAGKHYHILKSFFFAVKIKNFCE